jgi:hypothetical protein
MTGFKIILGVPLMAATLAFKCTRQSLHTHITRFSLHNSGANEEDRPRTLQKDDDGRQNRLELELHDRFGRWRWLQSLLDEDTDADETNKILFMVLQSFRNKRADDEDSPEMTPSRRKKIDCVLEEAHDNTIKALLLDASRPDTRVLDQLEELLPDADEDEDAAKGLWDTVIAIHGAEAVKQNEMSGQASWHARCLVARILIFYDFLFKGVQEPL